LNSSYKINAEIEVRIVRHSYLSLHLLQIIINVTLIFVLRAIANTLKIKFQQNFF
jgi:hypothetical protein